MTEPCSGPGRCTAGYYCPIHGSTSRRWEDRNLPPAPVIPMAEAMDLFDRFWNATFAPAAEDWTAYGLVSDGLPCECGNCQTCGIRYALLWTHNLLSNPSLADLAERRANERRGANP